MANTKETKREEVSIVRYIAIKPCVYKGVWLDRNITIDIPSNITVTHAALKPFDPSLVSKSMDELMESGKVFDPIKEALEKRRVEEATRGLTPNL